MSESKARLAQENRILFRQRDDARMQLAGLLRYVIDMQEDHPNLNWPPLPDQYDQSIWRAAV